MPCYDLTLVTDLTVGLRQRRKTSGTTGFTGLTGGEYKIWERIHRSVADLRLLAIPASRGRVSDLDPNWDRF